MKKIIAVAVLGVLGTGCSVISDWSTGSLYYSRGAKGPGISEKATVDFRTISAYVFSNCLECHSGTRDPNLRSIDAIRSFSQKIADSVNSNAMPPQGAGYSSLNECQKLVLNKWLEKGAPENSQETVGSLGSACQQAQIDPNPVIDQQPILEKPLNYETLYKRIIQPRCLFCHNNGPKNDPDAAEYPLFPYSSLVGQNGMLDKDISKSKLFEVLTAEDADRMPPAEDSARLSDEQIEFVRRWLESGFPEK